MPRKTVRPKLPDDPRAADPRAIEQTLLKNDLAREAFEELTRKWGVNRERLMRLLLMIPYCSNKVVPLVEGMGDVTVRRLPGRIRRWAETIKKVNASPSLRPYALENCASVVSNPALFPKPLDTILTPEWAGPAAKLFNNMPGNLHYFADYLEARLKFFHPTGPSRRQFGYKQIRLQTWFTLELLGLVRHSGHGPRYRQVATLLNRAYHVAGKARTITEEDLSQLERNNFWFTFAIRESLLEKVRQGKQTLS
jgi:hypothetical protein